MKAAILDNRKEGNGKCYLCKVVLEDYIANLPPTYQEYEIQREIVSIRGKGNKDTELRLIQFFRHQRITGWRRGWPIPGKPDFVFPKIKLVVFVDGCFWHGCSKHGTQPKNNEAFWFKKLTSNRIRDRLVTRTLRQQGWHVLRTPRFRC